MCCFFCFFLKFAVEALLAACLVSLRGMGVGVGDG